MSHPSRSDEQQVIEVEVRKWLMAQTGLTYESERVRCRDVFVDIDAVGRSSSGKVVELVEVYAHQGKLQGGQLKKPTDDAARLKMAQKQFPSEPKLRLAWCCEVAIGQLQRSWRGAALEAMDIEVVFVDLPESSDQQIRAAQKRQTR